MGGVVIMPYFVSMYTGIPYNYETNEPKNFSLPSSTVSLMTSILSCGTFFGSLIAGDLADFVGRRATIIYGCLVFCVGCIMQVISTNQLALFVMGRLVAGLGVGFISAVIILYMSEIAPRKVRGALVSGYQFCITLGILLANCVTYSTSGRSDSLSYRIPVAMQFLWALILGVGLYLLRKLSLFCLF
jgi:MFS family permease